MISQIIPKILGDQRIRFLITGGVNTAAGYGTFALLLWLGTHYLSANVAATVVGVTCSYFLNKYFTFRQYKKSYSEALRFVSVYAVSFLLGCAALYLLVDLLSVSAYAAGVLNLVFTTLISWFGHKYFSFRTDT